MHRGIIYSNCKIKDNDFYRKEGKKHPPYIETVIKITVDFSETIQEKSEFFKAFKENCKSPKFYTKLSFKIEMRLSKRNKKKTKNQNKKNPSNKTKQK